MMPDNAMPEDMETLQHDEVVEEPESTGSPNVRLIATLGSVGLIVVVGLILAAFFLPPFNLAAALRCQAVDANNPTLAYDDGSSVNWVGPDSVRVCFDSIPLEQFQAGQTGGRFSGALEAIPPYLQIKSALYTAEVVNPNGSVAMLEIPIPADSQTSYQSLDLYRWDDKNRQWIYVPGHVDSSKNVITTDEMPDNMALFSVSSVNPLIGTILEANDTFDASKASGVNIVMPTGLNLQPDNTIAGSLIGGWQLSAGYAVVPVIRSTDPNSLSSVLNDQASLALHVDDIKSFVVGDGYNGVAIDYRDLNPDDKAAFSKFIGNLAAALHPYNKMVVVILPPPNNTGGVWDTGGFDWRAIGKAADMIVISPGNNPADYAVNGKLSSLLTWAVGEVNRFKLHVAFSALSVQDNAGNLSLISYNDALAGFGKVRTDSTPAQGQSFFAPGSQISFGLDGSVADLAGDQNTGSYTYTLNDASGAHKIWIVMGSTVRARLDMANSFHVGGMVVNDLFVTGNDNGAVTAIDEFKANTASSIPNGLSMAWTVNGASGAVLTQNTGLGTPFVWQPNNQGNFTVQGAIVSGGSSDRGSVAVKVAELPTAAPTPTKAPVVVRPSNPSPATQPPANSAPPPVVGSVNSSGGFQLGGQVPGGIGHAAQMKTAGMTWVKYQHKWGPGDSPGSVAGMIAEGHANGFKVLLSIPGPSHPASIDYGSYASFLGGVAAEGADGIEVWNEMNFDREWPISDMGGANYVTKMLAPAFNAIKSANAGTMVISGAPTPTGAFPPGCGYFDITGEYGCNDYEYIAAMRDAGANSYADCIGVHFNAGATSPSATTGHPKDAGDHHYSWYYQPMVNLYYGTFGKQLCFTELGYASAEGLGTAPDNFSWANSVTVAEQAQWLAETAVMASQSGKVRLLVVWNVDFSGGGSDPQGMYAIVRPGGICPACDSLGAVMH